MNRSQSEAAVRRSIVSIAVAICLGVGGIAPVAATPPTTITTIEAFEAVASDWFVASGPASITSVDSPTTQGAAAMKITYDFASRNQAALGPRRSDSAPELPGLPRRLSLDVHGDGSWNVIYLQVRDATGEIFHYRMGNVSFNGWQTMSVDPGRVAPATTLSGNGDGILDLPVQVYRLIVDKNPGGLKTASSIVVDRLTYEYEAWSPLRATKKIFAPSAPGQATTIRLGPMEAGNVSVILTDDARRDRNFAGPATGGGAELAFAWNGRDDGGTLMTGSIRARLTIVRGADTWSYAIPYIAGLPARYENPIPGSIVGINSTLTTINTIDRSKAESQATLMEGAWIRMARESFDWNRVEPRQGWFEWAKFDQAVEVLQAHNIGVLGRLEYSADWASSAPSSASASSRVYYPPSKVSDFATYAGEVVRRFKDRIHVWEIWNEQNSSSFWKPGPSATGYAALLKAAYAAIKAEDPTATVVFGGTVGFDRAFMDGIHAAGAWNSFDALAIHTYVAPQPESSMIVTWLDNARAYLDTKGAKSIWITEFGWSTYSGSGSSYIGVSEAKQAQYTARTYLHAARVGVAGVFAYELMEHGNSTSSKLDNYGLVELGGRKKPVYGSLRRVAEALDQGTTAGIAAPFSATRQTIDTIDSIAGWSAKALGGGWAQISSVSARHGGTGSMRLDYSFTGSSTGVELVRNLAIAGSPSTISVWVYGDASANPVYVKVADKTGETFQAAVGTLQKSWQRMVLYGDGADINWTHSGGDNNGVMDYPITLKSIFVFRGGIGKLSGVAHFDDVQVETGPRIRGVVISRRSGDNQALYTLGSPTAIQVPITGDKAWQLNGATSTSLPVSGGKVSIAVDADPVNVLSAPGLSPTTISPDGDGNADVVTQSWISGDQTRYAFQIISGITGRVIRTVDSNVLVDAGLRTVTWDGKIGGVRAAPGNYRMRIAVLGPDGRVSYLFKTVAVV